MGIYGMLVRSYRALLDSTKEAAIRTMMGVLIFLGYILLSLFMYAIMRRVMVPQKLHVKPVHLYFNPECQAEGTAAASCPFPKAEFLLNDGQKLLSSGQHYRISLELWAPESPVNEAIGVFMVNITLYTTNHHFLSTSARPAMVKYKSSLLRTLSTVIFAVPLLLGVWNQDQEISVPLYEAYYEPYGDGTISATVSILSPHIQLYSASLTIDAKFGGFTYYLYQWPVTMSVIVIVSIFVSLCTCTLVLWVRDVLRDYDSQRRQRRPARQQRQGGGVVSSGTGVRAPPAQNPQQGGGGGGGATVSTGAQRRPMVMPRPPHSASVGPTSGLPPYTPQGVGGAEDDRTTPTPSEVSESTGVGVEDVTTSSQIGSAQSEMSSVVGDTDTEGDGAGAGLDSLLHTLRSLDQDLEEREMSGEGGREGERGREETVRRRAAGQLT